MLEAKRITREPTSVVYFDNRLKKESPTYNILDHVLALQYSDPSITPKLNARLPKLK